MFCKVPFSVVFRLVFICFIVIYSHNSKAQSFPKGLFISPINPGKPNFLNGNFGEIRPDHFHAGIDFRTELKVGLPVYAPASGYVSRILVMDKGYGNALFLRHDNGYITVHGHLEEYAKPIAAFLRKKQYEKQSFAIDLNFDKNNTPFRFRQGDTVAFGGNTGTSFGPHLHFEIRDTLNNLLNPLDFGFKELKDNIPPVFYRIALRTLDINSRVQSEFGVFEFYPQKLPNGDYFIKNPIPVSGMLGLEVMANDLSEGSFGRNGIQCMEVRVDGKEIYSHHLESFPYELSRFSNIHIDYEMFQKGLRYEKCFVDDGNALKMYQTDKNSGKIIIKDEALHEVIVTLYDSYMNVSHLQFTVKGAKPDVIDYSKNPVIATSQTSIPALSAYGVSGNTLVIKAKTPTISLFVKQDKKQLTTVYKKGYDFVYLYDLRQGLPDSVGIDNQKLISVNAKFSFRQVIVPQTVASFTKDSLKINFSNKSLFDTLYLEVEKKQNTVSVGRTTIPLQSDFSLAMVPAGIKNKAQTGWYLLSGKNFIYQKSEWNGDTLKANPRYFGTFAVVSDTIPPVAKLRGKPTSKLLNCTIGDERSGIASYRATLNGEWLLMNFDLKNARLWSETGKTTDKLLKGKFKLEVIDNAGNKTVLETDL
jgi:hypothetical protein